MQLSNSIYANLTHTNDIVDEDIPQGRNIIGLVQNLTICNKLWILPFTIIIILMKEPMEIILEMIILFPNVNLKGINPCWTHIMMGIHMIDESKFGPQQKS